VQFTIGLVQHEAAASVEANIRKAEHLVAEAAARGASLVGLQELFNLPYFPMAPTSTSFFALAEPVDGPSITAMMALARRLRVHLVVPFFELATGQRYFNSAALVSADGNLVGLYRKSHIPRLHRDIPGWGEIDEKFYFEPSALGYPAFPTTLGNVGMLICHDRHFPETARSLALAGADLVIVPSASLGVPGSVTANDVWLTELKALAIANSVFVCGINRVGAEHGERFLGHSCVVGPAGEVLAEATDQEQVITAEVDPGRLPSLRLANGFRRDRRPETYGALVR
jgi:beta-ureidopropionase